MTTRTVKETKKMLRGVKGKFPSVDIESLLRNLEIKSEYPGVVKFSLQFEGSVFGQSVVKTALSFAHYNGIQSSVCGLALSYLRAAAEPPLGYYYERDLFTNRRLMAPLHCVAMSGIPETGLLLGYVEYFGVFRVVVCLSDAYSGPEFDHGHAIDPITGEMFSAVVPLRFSRSELRSIYSGEKIPKGSMEEAFSNVIPAALERNVERERRRVAEDAFLFAWKSLSLKEGDEITAEHIEKLSRVVAQRMVGFIARNRR